MKLTGHELREVINSILCTWGSTKELHGILLWQYLVQSLKNGRHSTDLNWRGIGILWLSGYVMHKEGIATRKKENNRGSGGNPSYSFPWNPFPFSKFLFFSIFFNYLWRFLQLALSMLCTPYLSRKLSSATYLSTKSSTVFLNIFWITDTFSVAQLKKKKSFTLLSQPMDIEPQSQMRTVWMARWKKGHDFNTVSVFLNFFTQGGPWALPTFTEDEWK